MKKSNSGLAHRTHVRRRRSISSGGSISMFGPERGREPGYSAVSSPTSRRDGFWSKNRLIPATAPPSCPREVLQHVLHGQAHATDARLAATLARLNRDPREEFAHDISIRGPDGSGYLLKRPVRRLLLVILPAPCSLRHTTGPG